MIGYKFPTTARSQYVGIMLYKFLCVFKQFFTNSFYYLFILFYFIFIFENQWPWLHYDNMT